MLQTLLPVFLALIAGSKAAPTATPVASCTADVWYQVLEGALVSSAASSFCRTYIAPETKTTSTPLPTALSLFSTATSRLSSACSCMVSSDAPVATCAPNACLLVLDAAALVGAPVGQDCSSYLRTTVTPATVTSTSTQISTVTASPVSSFVTSIVPTTTSLTSFSTSTTVQTDDIIVTIEDDVTFTSVIPTTVSYIATTVLETLTTGTTTVAAAAKRAVTSSSSSSVPKYAAVCAARYASLCSCFGVGVQTITAATPAASSIITQTTTITPTTIILVTQTTTYTSSTVIGATATSYTTVERDIAISVFTTTSTITTITSSVTSTSTVDVVATATAQPAALPQCACPAEDLAENPTSGVYKTSATTFTCGYELYDTPDPEEQSCTYSKSSGSLVSDNDEGYCPEQTIEGSC